MTRKNKITIGVLFSFAFASGFYAQNSSPYSYFGVGGFNNVDDARNISLGNTGIALDAPDYINSKNPASMTSISTRNVIFNVSGILKYNTISSNLGTDNRFNSNFTNFSAAFRISRKFFVGLSLQPATSSDYKISSKIPIEGTSNEYPVTYEGSGGLSNWGASVAYKINDNWSVGGKVKNNFGKIIRKETIITTSEVEISRNVRYTGFSYNLGAHFKKDFSDNFQLTIGSIVNFGNELVSKREVSYTENQDYPNTLITNLSSKDTSLPFEMGAGFGILAKERYRLTFDFMQSNWEKVKNTETSERYYRQNTYGFGFEILPRKKRFEKISEAFIYRFGVNYDTGYYKVNKAKIDKLEITAGLGILLNKVVLNVGYGYGIHGLQKNVAIKENYHMLNISMNILDTWFKKRYLD